MNTKEQVKQESLETLKAQLFRLGEISEELDVIKFRIESACRACDWDDEPAYDITEVQAKLSPVLGKLGIYVVEDSPGVKDFIESRRRQFSGNQE